MDELIKKLTEERDEARREADRLRHGNTIEGDFVCSMELSAMAATMARESLEATIRFELHALPEESPLDACRRVYAERDEARAEVEHAYREGGALYEAKIAEREAFRSGAEAMREACAVSLMADGLVLSRERAANVVRALPIPEEL